jgi:hypothetical protein
VVMEGVNHLVVSGVLEHNPTVRFREDGTSMCRGTIRVDRRLTCLDCGKTHCEYPKYDNEGRYDNR